MAELTRLAPFVGGGRNLSALREVGAMMRVIAASITLCAVCARADMASLVVPAGDEMTISASATYDTVTVNGTLIVSAGTLTATNAFRIADGAGATGTLVITNSGKISSAEGTLAVGVNGGSGTVRVHATGNVCRFVEIGDGGGASVLRYAGGQIQSRNIRKKGSGTCRLEFAGGSHHFGMPRWFQLDEGQLTLASVDGAPIELLCAGNNPGWHYFAETSGSGTMATEGTGAVGINFRGWVEVSQMFSLETNSRIVWGHTGGFALKGVGTKWFKASSPDFFLVGGAPAKVGIYGGWLDLLGKHVPMKDISGWGGITNTANDIGAVVLGGDGGDHALRGGLAWSPKAALCKIGAGTLTYNGDDFTGRVIVSNGVFRAAAVHDVAYSHYRFVIDDCMGTARNSMQLSEFRLLCGGLDVTSSRSGYTFGDGADDRFTSNQGPERALDGLFTTKWLTMKTGASNAEDLYKTNCWLQLDFDHPCAISGYDWAAADDYSLSSQGSACRDPMKWRLLGSDDGKTWTLLDSRDIGKKDLARAAWTGPYSVSDAKETSFGAIDLAGGVFEVDGRVASADIVQNGGDFRIAETGAVRLVDGEWRAPSFAAGSSGMAVSDSSSANKVLCEGASFRGDLAVNSGALEFYVPMRTTHRLFRFTIKKTHSDTVCTQLSRLRLFDADGNVLSDGLTAANPGTAPASLPAGKCAYAANYSQGGSSSVKNLFDGSTSTKMCLTSLSMGGAPENNTWRTVVFRLAAGVTAPVVSYQLTTANDNTPARNPSVWTLESSADGENWTLLDGRSPGEFVNPMALYADFNNGVPMALRSAATIPVELVTLEDGALLSVASGASLGPAETTFSTAGLRVDCAAGAGTISCFAPRAGGRLELVGVPNGTNLAGYVVPITIQSIADRANLKTWTVFVDGAPKGSLYVVADGNGLRLVRKGMRISIR